MGYCNLPEKIVGPYNQTLFLGCSVTSFNCNLGWGSEQSTLSVNLVEDKCFHPQSNEYLTVDTKLNTITQQEENVQGGTAFHKNADGSYKYKDPTKALHKNMAFEMKNLEDSRDNQNIRLPPEYKDFGKLCYDTNGMRTYWTNKDPMFVGLSGDFNPSGLDILGTPVRFKFNEFTFGGLVSSWRQNGSEGGSRLFDIEIKSFSSLLNGCQLIIGKYAGTVCGIVPGTQDNPTNKNLAMPMPYKINNDTTPPTFTFFNHEASIEQGNIPNVFNVFGYLEYQGYKNKIYGNAALNDEGMRAQFIYDTVNTLLGPNSENNTENKNPFSPYGSIISRTVRQNGTAAQIDPTQVQITDQIGNRINLTHMGICPNSLAIDGFRRCRLKIDLSEVPRPPRWLRFPGPVMSLMEFITQLCDGSGFDFFIDFNFPTPAQLAQNISGIIKVRTVSRRKHPKKDQIQALINSMAQNGGVSSYTKGKEFTDSDTRTMYVGGKQKRLLQLKATRLAYKQNTLVWDPWANNGNGSMINYDLLQSMFTTPNSVRMPNTSSTRRYSFKYIAGAGGFQGGANIASSALGYGLEVGGSAVTSESSTFDTDVHFAHSSESRSIKQGNYNPAISLGESQGFLGSIGVAINKNIELYKDTICPYFGVGSNGLIRPVYFDKNMGQLQIVFQTADIQDLTSLPLSTYNPYSSAGVPTATTASSPIFLVLENEIRAAGGGFQQWLEYTFSNYFTTDIGELLYNGFKAKYGWNLDTRVNGLGMNTAANVRNDFLAGIGIVMGTATARTILRNGRPMQLNLNDVSPHFATLYNDLEKIHAFFQNIATEYYGKQFMVRIPELAWYRDLSHTLDSNNNKIQLGTDENNVPIYALEGTGKIYSNFGISTDGAWEEPGNYIDDTLIIGGTRASTLSETDGKLPCIIGYNASREKDHARRWNRQQFLNVLARKSFSDQCNHRVFDWEFILERMLNDPELQDENHYFTSVRHNLDPDNYGLVEYIAPTVIVNTAHGQVVSDNHKYKLYVKGTPSENIQFLSPNTQDPRAIVQIPSPVVLGHGKHAVEYSIHSMIIQDGLLRMFRGSSIPQVISNLGIGQLSSLYPPSTTILGGLGNSAYFVTPQDLVAARIITQISHMSAWGGESGGRSFSETVDEQNRNSRSNSTISSPDVLAKAAIPMFCALPIEFNDFIYGPWINHPGLIASSIFPDSTDANVHKLEVENLIGGVKVNVDDTLVPWNFGGMTALDEAVMFKIADEVNYQQTIETGTVQLPGFDNFSLGDMIQYYGNLFSGPIINSIQVQIGQGGITTTYNFRTYIRKLGLFNKENSERIKALGIESFKRNKELNTQLLKLASKLGLKPGGLRII